MFSTDIINKDGFQIVVLSDTDSATSAEIIPACGGILHAFKMLHPQSGCINVIEQYATKEDFEQHVAAKGFKSCKLSPFACRIKNGTYQFAGNNYTIEKFFLGTNAIHGLIYDANFSVLLQSANEENATLVLQHEYRGTDKGYPFFFDCTITYQLKKNNELSITTEIINRDNKSIPVQDGWHPYFTLGKKVDELELQINSLERIIFDDKMIPTGKLLSYKEFTEPKKIGSHFFDDCFKLDFDSPQPLCILKDVNNKIQIEISPDKSYPYLQIYTPPNRQSIAIENLSAPPDAFNNGINLMILLPGDTANFATCYKLNTTELFV
jgi:aldose 1-epimerase